ncbi:MAG: hypothetical protein ACOZHQ_11940 [Thermodesulfobacteriota bacterium]
MRALVYDELRRVDIQRLAERLAQVCLPSNLDGVYWLNLPPDLLSPEQAAHPDCGPHRVALVLEPENESLRLELLVRASNSLRCACTAYATEAQRRFMLNFLDKLVAELDLRT